MKQRKIDDLARSLRNDVREESAALQSELLKALESGDHVMIFAQESWGETYCRTGDGSTCQEYSQKFTWGKG